MFLQVFKKCDYIFVWTSVQGKRRIEGLIFYSGFLYANQHVLSFNILNQTSNVLIELLDELIVEILMNQEECWRRNEKENLRSTLDGGF